MIGEMRNRVMVKRYTYTVDAGGGTTGSLSTSYSLWAKVENRTGSGANIEQRSSFPYNYRITVRHNKLNPILQTDLIVYDSKNLKIGSLVVNQEGKSFFVVLGCNTIE